MRFLAVFCIVFAIFSISASAEGIEQSIIDKQFNAIGADVLEDNSNSAKDFDEQFSFKSAVKDLSSGKFPFTLKDIYDRIVSNLIKEVRASAVGGAQLIFTAILIGLMSHFSLSEKGVFDTAFFVCYAVVLGIAVKIFEDAAQIGKNTVNDMVIFMKSAVPVMAVLSVSTLNPAKAGISALALQGIHITAWVIQAVFMPLVYVTAAMCATGNLTKEFNLKGFIDLAKKCTTWGIGFILTVFSGIMIAHGMVASAMDNVAGKATKFAVGSFIPIVGGIMSDSLDTIIACGKVLKNAVGVAGIIAVAIICLTPVIKLAAMILILKLSGAIAGLVSDARITSVIDDFAGLLCVIEAIVLGVSLMFIVALAILAAGTGVTM